MIISSFNIRGLGGAVKRNSIKELLRKENVDFLALQETKLESISDSVCYGLWGDEDCQWVSLPSVGNSGGILSIGVSPQPLLFILFLEIIFSVFVLSGVFVIRDASL
jgi:hypothetical protein